MWCYICSAWFLGIIISTCLLGIYFRITPPSVIHQANQEVMKIIEKRPQQSNDGKRKPY